MNSIDTDETRRKKKLTGYDEEYRRVVQGTTGATGNARRFPRTVRIREKKT